jgi:antitoxin (DNA-binding transcriptional repressor) of toxin-antitoxin stability system
MYHMAKASIRDLRYHFERVEAQLDHGEAVEITRRGRVVARLLPPETSKKPVKMPDFRKRLKELWGDRVLPSSMGILDYDREERF